MSILTKKIFSGFERDVEVGAAESYHVVNLEDEESYEDIVHKVKEKLNSNGWKESRFLSD